MRARNQDLLNVWVLALVFLIRASSFGLNTDGVLLLSLKYSITSDPFGALLSWGSQDDTPCSWNGVTCGTPGSGDAFFRVTGLSLPNFGLHGSLPSTLGMIQHLQHLDLSNNSINSSIPSTLFTSIELQLFDLSHNFLSGKLPELVGELQNLRFLNLSDNGLVGNLPMNLTTLPNLTAVSLRNNYFSGSIPAGFNSVEILDLSSNLINGSLPPDFNGSRLSYFNASHNRLTGEIPAEFATQIPSNATVDLSYNNLTGHIPASVIFFNQASSSFSGNDELCGEPLKKTCHSGAPPPSAPPPAGSPPAIAAIPKTIASDPSSHGKRTGTLTTATIVAIVIGDVAGLIVIAVVVLMYVCYVRKRRRKAAAKKEEFDWALSAAASTSEKYKWLSCLKKQRHTADDHDDDEESTSESEEEKATENDGGMHAVQHKKNTGTLVTVDGARELELETLLKASAYILGASGSSIMYKAVLEDGETVAVRRIGENGVERFKDFENQIRVIAKVVHPNLVRIRGFYWGVDEKLIIYDFVPNGSLANARYRKAGCSPCPLPWEMRLRIAKGVARGLSYIHEKKHVHGNLKPGNILLGADMEPKIGDFGLERHATIDHHSSKAGGSAWNFGSKRSTASCESFQDLATPSPSSGALGVSPYHAPESLRSLKPHPKWDVFSFGVVLLELLTGKVILSDEMGPGLAIGATTSAEEIDKGKVLRMADVAIRSEMEGKEDALLALLRLGYSCISPVPQKRPSMKEALQALDRFPICSFS